MKIRIMSALLAGIMLASCADKTCEEQMAEWPVEGRWIATAEVAAFGTYYDTATSSEVVDSFFYSFIDTVSIDPTTDCDSFLLTVSNSRPEWRSTLLGPAVDMLEFDDSVENPLLSSISYRGDAWLEGGQLHMSIFWAYSDLWVPSPPNTRDIEVVATRL